MVEQAQDRSGDPDVGPFDIDPFNENTVDAAPYGLGAPALTEDYPDESVPLFLSDPRGQPDPTEYLPPLRKERRASIAPRIIAVAAAAVAVVVLFALFSSDATREIVNVTASIAGALSTPSAVAKSNPSQPTPREKQPNQSPQRSALEDQSLGLRSVTTAAGAPTREEIKTAYQSALQSGAPLAPVVAPAVAVIPGDAIHHLDPDEIDASLKRGDALIASGDLAAARLVLRRAADAGDARAAMMLAETYDPAVLAKLGVHGVVPDLALARDWYEKAKHFGAVKAAERLELPASKQR